MVNSIENKERKHDLGRHFLGVFMPGRSAKSFFSKNLHLGDDYITRMPNQEFGIRFAEDSFVKRDTLAFSEFTNSKISLFFGGEIYNFNELCEDLNVPFDERSNMNFAAISYLLYDKFGRSFAKKINGLFSIVLLSHYNKILMLYADRFAAAKPIYYSFSNKFIFSSQLKLLMQCSDIRREINKDSLAIFLKYSYIPAPLTILQNVYKLGPGEFLTFHNNRIEKSRYIDFETNKYLDIDGDAAVEAYSERLKTSILEKMKGFDSGKIGFFLSGGLDSSANVAFASLYGNKAFNTFGVGFEDPELDERPYARLVAEHFGVKFQDYLFDGDEIEDLPKIVWHMDEPFMENGLFLTYAGFKAAKNHSDLVIAGDGADQLFGTGGFATGRPIALRYLFDKFHCRNMIAGLRKYLFRPPYKDNLLFKSKVMIDRAVDFNDWFFWGFDESELKKLCNFSINSETIKCFSNIITNNGCSFSDHYKYAVIHQDIEHYACQNVMVKSFKMAELHNLNLRETYLDYNVVDFLLSINACFLTKGNLYDFLKGNRTTKYLHRKSMYNLLPKQILNKPKQGGCIPMAMLLRDSQIRKKIFRYILKSNAVQSFMDKKFISNLLKQYEQENNRQIFWQPFHDCKVNQIMNLLVFAIWFGMFIEGKDITQPNFTLTQFIDS